MGAKNTKPTDDAKSSSSSSSSSLTTTNQQAVVQNPHAGILTPLLYPAMPACMRIQPVRSIVEGYLAYDIQIPSNNFRFSIYHSAEVRIYQEAFAIARDHVLTARFSTGRPLDPTLDAKVEANPKVLLPRIKITMQLSGIDHTFEGTLEQLALINLDQTITSADPNVTMIDEGMAERLRELRVRLLPDTLPLALDQARLALPTEEDKKDKDIEARKILNDIFEQIKQDKPVAARNIMKRYIKNIRPAVITDNRYFLHLLQLIPRAYNLLFTRAGELKGTWYGNQADQYFFTTVGVIETALPFRFRQISISGVFDLLYKDKKTSRDDDVSDPIFIGVPESGSVAGVTYFYDEFGLQRAVREGAGWAGQPWLPFESLYRQLHQRSKLFAALEHTTEMRDFDSIKFRSP